VSDWVNTMKKQLKRLVPVSLLEARRRWLNSRSIKRVDKDLVGKPASEIFSEIYDKQLWGRGADNRKFSSGYGSHMELHVVPYVAAVGEFIGTLAWKPGVIDFGCGDFNVGSRIRGFFNSYIAADIAQQVLDENKVRFADLNVDFRRVDIIADDLPDADICIIRQVLQHFSNSDIARVLPKLSKYKILILTEPLPKTAFTPNLDQPTGVSSRMGRGIPSGVVLTQPPFSMEFASSSELCSTVDNHSHARLVTTAHWLR
jgi:hypothetical protein